MSRFKRLIVVFSALALTCGAAHAGKLSIVIDDFGYRPANEKKILAMPKNISIAVLPDAPHAREMAVAAHQQGREVLIHLPMAPLSKQPLERNTLHPAMSREEVSRIVAEAVGKVPYASGLNNHMGSAMTSSLSGMQNVMQVLSHYRFYFLDSMTIAGSQSQAAAAGTGVKVIKRNVFLDDSQNEAEIRKQFTRAFELARRKGHAIAIGHPHPATIRVLQQMLPALPADIELVRPSMLLDEPVGPGSHPRPSVPAPAPVKPRNPFHGIGLCAFRHRPSPVYADAMFKVLSTSIVASMSDILSSRRTLPQQEPATPK